MIPEEGILVVFSGKDYETLNTSHYFIDLYLLTMQYTKAVHANLYQINTSQKRKTRV